MITTKALIKAYLLNMDAEVLFTYFIIYSDIIEIIIFSSF